MSDASEYGDAVADVYDSWHEGLAFLDPAPVVEYLATLAGPGPVLEVGVGTGRVAIPLAERGLEVHGIDVSTRMIERLRAKDSASRVKAYAADFLTFRSERRFTLVYLAFNTLFAFASQEAQLRVFANARSLLDSGGLLVLETYFPNVRRDQPSRLSAMAEGSDGLILEASRHDFRTQEIDTTWVQLRASGLKMVSLRTRYVWPPELDLMARLNGFELVSRLGGWAGQPFTASSTDYVSAFRLLDESGRVASFGT